MTMKRILIASVGCLALSAPAALACDFHGADYSMMYFGEAGEKPPEIKWETPAEALAAQEATKAEAMQAARASFLSRFAVKVEDAPAESEQPKLVQASLTQDSDADRRSRAVAQDR